MSVVTVTIRTQQNSLNTADMEGEKRVTSERMAQFLNKSLKGHRYFSFSDLVIELKHVAVVATDNTQEDLTLVGTPATE